MPTLYLKAAARETLLSALETAGELIEHDGGEYTLRSGETHHPLRIIGTIWFDPPVDEFGEPTAPPEAIEGYHANLLWLTGEIPEALSALMIEAPGSPVHAFAA